MAENLVDTLLVAFSQDFAELLNGKSGRWSDLG